MANRKLYLFDFDGTISNRDSFSHFLISMFGFWKIFFMLIVNLHTLVYTAINEDMSVLKELILSIFLKGKSKEEIIRIGTSYFENHINKIVRPKFIEYLKVLDRSVSEIYIVSASLNFWLKDFALQNNIKLITTELAYENNCFTGRFNGMNCKGAEKVNRIEKEVDLTFYDEIFAFGNSKGDFEMLSLATKKYYKPFRN
jgi:HAD superfamily hydrolase (TIGR01490 family)